MSVGRGVGGGEDYEVNYSVIFKLEAGACETDTRR